MMSGKLGHLHPQTHDFKINLILVLTLVRKFSWLLL